MKRSILLALALVVSFHVAAKEYDPEKLAAIVKVWGEAYLFHPSVVRSDKTVEWEKQLVEFLPSMKGVVNDGKFVEELNARLIPALDDSFTVIQPLRQGNNQIITELDIDEDLDYIRLDAGLISDMGTMDVINRIAQRSERPLVIDLRIDGKLNLDPYKYNFLEYFLSAFITEPLIMSPAYRREHFGWDEYNDWAFYEQRWSVAGRDKQQAGNGMLLPLSDYFSLIARYAEKIDQDEFVTVTRPLYLLTNDSFLSYYYSIIGDLRNKRPETYIINQTGGRIYLSRRNNLVSYGVLPEYEFILNTAFYGRDLIKDMEVGTVTGQTVKDFVFNKKELRQVSPEPSLQIIPVKYNSTGTQLSQEEKILGIAKIYTIIRYFHIGRNEIIQEWDDSLVSSLELALQTSTDKEYYELVKRLLAPIRDSHISVFHPSIVDFNKFFTSPIWFEWVDGQAVVTAIDDSVTNGSIEVGDQIIAIDGVGFEDLLEMEKGSASYSNYQSLLSRIVHPGYFTGSNGSSIEYVVDGEKGRRTVVMERSIMIFAAFGLADQRPGTKIMEDNIGYINMATMNDNSVLEDDLRSMQNTEGLIIDLRRSYPTSDFGKFLRMLYGKKTIARLSEVPVVTATGGNTVNFQTHGYTPDEDFYYNKPIMVLVDKTMISRPEDIAIALSALPNVTFIGEQTQGTDGEISKIHMPGGGTVSFTGQNIKFGNGDNFMREGIIPDVEVVRTVEGVKNGKDEILDRAYELLITGSRNVNTEK